MEEVVLPPGLRDDGREVPYTAGQLAPTISRLRKALDVDLNTAMGTPQQRLAAAWTRIAELRLPRKAVPIAVLDEVERLVGIWDGYGHDGIFRHAYIQTDDEVRRARETIAWMLREAEESAAMGYTEELVPTD